MGRILCTGIATLDIVNTVAEYPPEDSEVRALAQRITRGGNAANTAVVLSQLGHRCSWAGVLSDDPDAARIREDLRRYGIDLGPCRTIPGGKVPTSYIALSRANGSRTIVHYRDLPEFAFKDFFAIDLGAFDWLHFEGRAVDETLQMLRRAAQTLPHLPRSLEVEKPRDGIDALFEYADVLLFSQVFAQGRGFDAPEPFLRHMRHQAGDADLVCAWGAEGAYAMDRDGVEYHSPAFPPPQVVDTLGAGDTLNAAVIHARLLGEAWPAVLERACRLAGRKCGLEGFAGLT